MKIVKRWISIMLALAMILTGVNLDGLVAEVKAQEAVKGPYYEGVMITEAEFQELTCGSDFVNWFEYDDFWERYKARADSIDEVLTELKQADYYWDEVEKSAPSTGYFLISAIATDMAKQSVTALDGVNGVVFASGSYKEPDRADYASDEEYDELVYQNDEIPWLAYCYPEMEIDVEAPITFLQGHFKDITFNYTTAQNVLFQQSNVEGTLRAAALNEGMRTVYFGTEVWLYGIENFDTCEFVVNKNGYHELRFNSSGGDEPIHFNKIEAARADAAAGALTPGITDNSERINLEIQWLDGKEYIPVFAGAAELGTSFWRVEYQGEIYNVWKWWDEENHFTEHRYLDMGDGFYEAEIDDQGIVHGVSNASVDSEMAARLISTEDKNQIGLSYFESFGTENREPVRHEPQAGEKALIYANSQAWGSGNYWYDGTDAHGEYRVDADGTLYDESACPFRVEVYGDRASWEIDYHEDGEVQTNHICNSGNIASALQAIAWYQELEQDKGYYKINLNGHEDETGQPIYGSAVLDDIIVPQHAAGIRFAADGRENEAGVWSIQNTGIINSIAIGAGQTVELTETYRAKANTIAVTGTGTLSVWNAKVQGGIEMRDDGVLVMQNASVAGSVSANPADGTIGTLQLYHYNEVNGLLGWKQLNYEYAGISVKDYQGIDLYHVSNGYDGENQETAKGILDIQIEGQPDAGKEPVFHEVMNLGRNTETINDGEEQYEVYRCRQDGEPDELYAKKGTQYYQITEDNGWELTGNELSDAVKIAALEEAGPSQYDCSVNLHFLKDFTSDDWENNHIDIGAGTKIVNFVNHSATQIRDILRTVSYDRNGLSLDIDGRTYDRNAEENIWLAPYTGDDNELTAEASFLQDYEGEVCFGEGVNTGSGEAAKLWLEAFAGDGAKYLKIEVRREGESFGNLTIPQTLKGLCLATASSYDEDADIDKFRQAELTSVTASADGQQIKLFGAFSGFTFDKGGTDAELIFQEARIDGILAAADAEVTIKNRSVVKSLEHVGILNLLDGLTVANTLSFAEDGKINANAENTYPNIYARSGANIEIPDVDCIYDPQEGYGNSFEIAEEVKNGIRSTIRFTGDSLNVGRFWNTIGVGVFDKADENDRTWFNFRSYWKDNSENADLDDVHNLLEIDGTVYQAVWGHEINASADLDEITLDGRIWKIEDENMRLRETGYSTDELEANISDNTITLIPYDAAKITDCNANILKDMYLDRNYSADLNGEWNMEYTDTAISEYILSDAAVSDETNFKKINVQYGMQQDGGFRERCINVYPVKQYLLDNDWDTDTFTEEDAYTDEASLRKYAMYAINYEECTETDNGVRTSSHYIKANNPDYAEVSLDDNAHISITCPDYTYTGSAVRAKPVVVYTNDAGTAITLVEGEHYTLGSYDENINVTTAASLVVTAVPDGGFLGEKTVYFKITAKPITADFVANVASQTFTGSKIEPEPVVKDGSQTLVRGTHYTVKYDKNINAGTAVLTVTGTGNYSGAVTKDFTIDKLAVSKLTIGTVGTQYYTGKAIEPKIAVMHDKTELKKDTDYKVVCKNNISIGKATITITGKGNYTGSVVKNFQIGVKAKANYTVGSYKYQITNAAANGKGTVTVTGPANKTLKSIKIADTVTIGGVKFKITEIAKNAFKSCTKAASITIGNNVKKIGDKAFNKCTAAKTAVIGKGVTQIGASAFAGDGKLKTITIKAASLKTVGKNVFKDINRKATIKVPSAKLKAYQKLLKSKGQSSTVKIKKS